MAIDKIIPRSLNKDDDFLLVKSTEMVDALNISVSTDDDGDAGVIKRAYGTELVPFATGSALPAGTNKVVGSCINREKNEIIYAVYNSNSNHSIYLYSVGTNSLVLVDRDSVWGFTASSWVKMDTIVKENGDTLLYLNDGVTDPKKINVTKAVSSPSYPYKSIVDFEGTPIYLYTSEEKLLSITAAKQPPLSEPRVVFINEPLYKGNNLFDQYFEFAYQYVYEDGEVSAISPYSKIAINSSMLSPFSQGGSSFYNAIDITVDKSLGDVSKIRILARDIKVNKMFLVEELDNERSIVSPTLTHRFLNNQIRQYIQERETKKLYDNVPKYALAQSIVANRLLYGANNEFYDNHSVSSSVSFNYDTVVSQSPVSVLPIQSAPSSQTSTSGSGIWMDIDLSSIPASSQDPIELVFDIKPTGTMTYTWNWMDVSVDPNASRSSFVADISFDGIRKTFRIPPYANRAAAAASIHPLLVGEYNGISSGVVSFSAAGNNYITTGTCVFELKYGSFSSNILRMLFVTTDANFSIFNVTNSTVAAVIGSSSFRTVTQSIASYYNINSSFRRVLPAVTSFKRSQFHQVGVVYSDGRNRSGAVNKIGAFRADGFNSLFNGAASMNVRITSNPPSWAKKWRLVYSPYTSYSFCYSYAAAEAFTSVNNIADGKKPIYVAMRHLEGKPDSYKEAKGAIFNYSYVKGDRLRVISYMLGGQRVYPSQDLDFEIVGMEILDSTNNSILSPASSGSNASERRTGIFLVLKDEGYSGFSSTDISSYISKWGSNVIFEIYRPSPEQENELYYEIGESYDVVFDSTSMSYKHKGQRDFQYAPNFTLAQNMITVSDFSPYGRVGTSSGLDVRNGDQIRIIVSAGVFQTFTVGNVFSVGGTKYFQVPSFVSTGTYQVDAITNSVDCVVTTYSGDVYFKNREIKMNRSYGTEANQNDFFVYYENHFIEDLSINDFIRSNYIGIGRPNAVSLSAKSVLRKATLTWSDPYVLDTSILGLSSFNLSDANFSDLQAEHGSIRYIASNSDSIIVLQDTKCSVLPVSRNVIEYADGSSGVTISNNFVGQQNFYAGDFGVGDHPESVAQYYGRVFFADPRTGKVIRISADGIELISDQGMEAFFDGLFETVNRLGSQNFKIYGGIDPRNGEYVISVQKISGAFEFENQTVGYSIDDKVWTTRYSYMPESISEINGELYTMKNGSLYRHSFGAPRCRFYGQDFPSSLRIISSQNGSMVKIFEALSQESTAPWSFSCSTIDQQTPVVLAANMEKKEGFYYHSIPTDSSKVVLSGVGPAASFSAGSIGFSFPITYMPIAIGDQVYVVSGSTATPTGLSVSNISEKAITVTGVGSVSAGNFIAVGASDSFAVNGEKLRGPYMIVDLEITGTSDSELYAINTWFNRSAQHNEMVN